MHRRDLLRRIAKAAKKAGVTLEVVREGGKHTIYVCGGIQFPVPRHTEINEYTAQGILADLEPVLGGGGGGDGADVSRGVPSVR